MPLCVDFILNEVFVWFLVFAASADTMHGCSVGVCQLPPDAVPHQQTGCHCRSHRQKVFAGPTCETHENAMQF